MAVQAFVVQGPLARVVDDLRLGLHAMEFRDPRDATAVHSVPWPRREPSAVRVALVTDPGGTGLAGSSTAEAVEAARAAGGWLSEAGYPVEEVEMPLLGEAAELWWKLALTEFKIAMVAEVDRVGEPGIRRFFDLMFDVYEQELGEVDLAGFVEGYARRGMIRREVSVFMDRYPLILTPVSGERPFPMGDDVLSSTRTAELMARQWPSMSIPVLGLPGLGMPALATPGAPLGVQIVGRAFDEETVFQAGEIIEARSGIATPTNPVAQ